MKNKAKQLVAMFVSLSLAMAILIAPIALHTADALSTISSSLGIGSTGADVTTLQTFLAQDASIYPQGLVTGYYGTLTAAAVTKFQAKYGLPQVGRVGPMTRAQINSLISSGSNMGGSAGGTTMSGPGQAPSISLASTALTPDNAGVVVSFTSDRPVRAKVYYSQTPIVATETSSPTMEPTIGGFVVTDDTYSTSKSITIPSLWSSTATTTATVGTTSPYYYMIEAIDQSGYVSVTWPRTVSSTGTSSTY